LFIPSDCVAGQDAEQHRKSLELMASNFAAHIEESARLDLQELVSGERKAA
jgi:hypothetical protein